jgi:hypothetical protein
MTTTGSPTVSMVNRALRFPGGSAGGVYGNINSGSSTTTKLIGALVLCEVNAGNSNIWLSSGSYQVQGWYFQGGLGVLNKAGASAGSASGVAGWFNAVHVVQSSVSAPSSFWSEPGYRNSYTLDWSVGTTTTTVGAYTTALHTLRGEIAELFIIDNPTDADERNAVRYLRWRKVSLGLR